MCDICQKEVIERGIRNEDLPMLPYTRKKWLCVVAGCKHGSIVRDYGNDPYYFDPRKVVRNTKRGSWRGGWFDGSTHYCICAHHSKNWDRVIEMMRHRFSPEYFLSKIIPYGNRNTQV